MTKFFWKAYGLPVFLGTCSIHILDLYCKVVKGSLSVDNWHFFILFELQPVHKASELLDKLLHSHAIYTLGE